MAYEKARIKLLDKNTGQVLKEVDPYTSADAVEYDGATSVEDRITELILYKDTNIVDVQGLKDKDTTFTSQIAAIQTKDATQDGALTSIATSINVIDNNIIDLQDYNDTQDNTVTLLQNSVYTKAQSDANYYTKTQSDTNYYTKAQADTNYYTKTAADTRYYTKTQVDSTVSTINSTITSTNTATTNTLTNQIITKGNNYAVTTGSNIAYTVSIAGVASYSDGVTVVILPHVDCGASPTIRINTLAYLQIKNLDGDLLSAGDLKAGIPIILVRVGSYFFIRASKKSGGLFDTTPDITPGSGTLLTSGDTIVAANDRVAEVVRIVNYETVLYRTMGNDLYTFNLRRNLATKVASGLNGYGPMKLWNKQYYIYGTKIYDLKFAEVASYATRTGDDFYMVINDADGDPHNLNFSNRRTVNHFIVDYSNTANLYFIEYCHYSPVQYYHSNAKYSSSYSDEFYGERIFIRVSRVNANFSLTTVCDLPSLVTYDDSAALAIKGNYVYIKEQNLTNNGTSNYSHFAKVDITNTASIVRTYQGLIRTRNSSAWDADQYRAYTLPSQEADRLIEIQTEHIHSSNSSDTDKTYYYIYDILSDTQEYYFYSSSNNSDPIYAFGGLLTNNPQQWTTSASSGYMDGIDPTTGTFTQSPLGYYGNLTSKYRLLMGSITTYTGTYPNYVYTYKNHVEIYKL